MNKGVIVAIVIAVIFIGQLGLRLMAGTGVGAPEFPRSTLVIHSGAQAHSFKVQVASTDQQRAYGLMFRKYLADDAGMIFLFEPPEVIQMWMKNTFIPLDMVFLDRAGTVTDVLANAKPQDETVLSSSVPDSAVIELKGGIAGKLGIKVGDHVDSPDLQKLKPVATSNSPPTIYADPPLTRSPPAAPATQAPAQAPASAGPSLPDYAGPERDSTAPSGPVPDQK